MANERLERALSMIGSRPGDRFEAGSEGVDLREVDWLVEIHSPGENTYYRSIASKGPEISIKGYGPASGYGISEDLKDDGSNYF